MSVRTGPIEAAAVEDVPAVLLYDVVRVTCFRLRHQWSGAIGVRLLVVLILARDRSRTEVRERLWVGERREAVLRGPPLAHLDFPLVREPVRVHVQRHTQRDPIREFIGGTILYVDARLQPRGPAVVLCVEVHPRLRRLHLPALE